MFSKYVNQPKLDTLELNESNVTDYVITKPKTKTKLLPLHGASMLNIYYVGYKMWIQFNTNPLVISQKKFTNKIVNVYIVHDLNNWPKSPLRNFALKSCLFDANNSSTK